MNINGRDARFGSAQRMMEEAAVMDHEDRRTVERAAAMYFWAALKMDGRAVGAAVRPLRGD